MRSIRLCKAVCVVLAAAFIGANTIGGDRGRVAHSEPAVANTPSVARPEVRYWVDVSGKHSVHATLVEIRGDTVYLQKTDGKFSAVPIRRLCNSDQAYVNSLHTDYILEGKIVGVTDADTIVLLGASNQQLKVRLEGIDGPESGQDFGTQAKKALSGKVFGSTARVEWCEIDKYGRILGHVLVDGTWINKQMLDEGMAWHYKEYNDSALLADAELKARAAKVGLWQDSEPVAPWVFRHPPKQPRAPPVVATTPARSTPSPPNPYANSLAASNRNSPFRAATSPKEQTVYVTNTGEKYHRAGCRYLSKSSIPMSLSNAAASHSPCSVCHPPVTVTADPSRTNGLSSHSLPGSNRWSNPPPSSTSHVNRNPYGETVTGRTATGIPTFTGPRGGRYHYSKSGKKVYERKKK